MASDYPEIKNHPVEKALREEERKIAPAKFNYHPTWDERIEEAKARRDRSPKAQNYPSWFTLADVEAAQDIKLWPLVETEAINLVDSYGKPVDQYLEILCFRFSEVVRTGDIEHVETCLLEIRLRAKIVVDCAKRIPYAMATMYTSEFILFGYGAATVADIGRKKKGKR